MGMGYWRVTFETKLPSFDDIQSLFYAQTGLQLGLKAHLQLQTLKTSSAEIFSLLVQDAEAVAKLEQEQQAFYLVHAGQYEEMARFRDKTKKNLRQFNYIGGVQFTIDEFYELDFSVKDNIVEIETYLGQEYGINSLVKVLIDLGGKFFRSDGSLDETYPKQWKKLKKWHEYKWYNRPKK